MFEFFDGVDRDALERLLGDLSHREADSTRQLYEFVMTCRLILLPLEQSLEQHQLTKSRARVLILLQSHAPDAQQGLSPGELATLADVRPATMTRLLDGLEKDNFVERVIDLADRRKLRILATEKGAETVRQIMSELSAGAQDAMADFSHQEYAYMTILLNKLQKKLAPEQQEDNG